MEKQIQEMMAVRQQQDEEWARDMEKHPRCGLLPSPEKLAIGFANPGKDATDTRKDFDRVHQWLKNIGALNVQFYAYYQKPEHSEFLNKNNYGSLIQLAFSNSFAAMRHTFNPELPEYVIWYYTGHGYDPNGDCAGKSSIPDLEKVGFNTKYNDIADSAFVPGELQDQAVKGGELCLHHVGYCGLYGLLKPWIAAVKSESMNCSSEKKNKHLIIILDSCYSGKIAQDLEELNKKEGPWNQNGCTVTIQAACSPKEPTYGGYFTLGFLTLNQNQSLLQELKKKWEEMDEDMKGCYQSLPQPSPKVVTTKKDVAQEPLTLEFRFNNNHRMTLFPDAGFFKFCSISIFDHEEEDLTKTRVLNVSTTNTFMSSPDFTVLDYKLKTLQNGQFAGHPMGLFLIADPNDLSLAVCAHVHFGQNDTSRVGKINLVHHKVPPQQNLLYVEDLDGLSKSQVKKGRHKIEYACVPKIPNPQNITDWEYWSWNTATPNLVPIPSHIPDPNALRHELINGARLVKKCHDFVESKEPGRWIDTSRWNQTANYDLSYMGELRRSERSEWMDKYLEKYKNETVHD